MESGDWLDMGTEEKGGGEESMLSQVSDSGN